MSYFITIDLDAYEQLPPRQLRAMLRLLRFADSAGLVQATLSTLAMPGLSRSAIHRDLGDLTAAGYIERQEEGGYRIAPRYRPRIVPTAGTAPVPEVGTTDSRARPFIKPSSELRSSEGELLSLQDQIPDGWIAAATTERRRVDLPDVDLEIEWRKLVIYTAGERVSRPRWLLWAMRARLDRTNTPPPVASPTGIPPRTLPDGAPMPGDDRQQRQARDWVTKGFWLRNGSWGPAPDQPGCNLPAELVAWCLRERQGMAA